MNLKSSILLYLSILVPFIMQGQSLWNNSSYNKLQYEDFFNIPEVNQPIDFNNIDYPLLNASIFYATNKVRVEYNLPRGTHSSALEKSAFDHSRSMVNQNFFSHTGVESGKITLLERTKSNGITAGIIAENIAITFGIDYEAGKPVYMPSQNGGYFSYSYKGTPLKNLSYRQLAHSVLKQWMDSPGHRQNILRGLAFIGCGAYLIPIESQDQFPKFKITQNFSSVDVLTLD